MSLRATNVTLGKQVNLWVVFETVRLHGPLSRSDIARETGLSKPSVSNLVDELQALGLVQDGEAPRTGRMGKPSTLVNLNPAGAFTLGLHLDYGQVTVLLTNLVGQIHHRATWTMETRDPASTVGSLVGRLGGLLAEAAISPARIAGLGLVMPGPFGVRGLWPTRLPDWDGIDIRDRLRRHLPYRVALANDGTGATVAEWRFGQARGLETFAYVFIGNGIGTGLVTAGRLFGGARGNAGEIAHIVVQPGGHRCICGQEGCLETYVSLDSAARFLAAHGVAIEGMADFNDKIRPEDPLIDAWIDQAVEPLRRGINLLENLLDPETIFLGGDFPDWLLDRLLARLHPLAMSVRAGAVAGERLRRASFGRDSAAIGAAALAIASALDPHADPEDESEATLLPDAGSLAAAM